MTLSAGSRLGPYEILGQIGAGGMGEVYRARDPRLAREVAIKVLPASWSSDPDRLRRFEQEARAAGALNHPNITAVYDVGTSGDAPYVVQELLEGETLRSALAGGPLSARRAIDYATQISHGLAAAHDKGIVHRDLKPENLFVNRNGQVKILDFGLAKLSRSEGADSKVTSLPTETAGTEPGVVLGTLGYMSPEQVRGKAADARSDIFSFGAILYEMISGQRAFRGDSAADTMSSILKEDPPDLSATNRSVPPGLERVVRHCLEKNPEQRFHSAHDLAFALDALSEASGPAASMAPGRRARGTLALPGALGAGTALLLIGFAAGRLTVGPPPAPPEVLPLTFSGRDRQPAASPDGKMVVFTSWRDGKSRIWVKQLGEGTEAALTAGPEDFHPRFSRDGTAVLFARASSADRRVSLPGRRRRRRAPEDPRERLRGRLVARRRENRLPARLARRTRRSRSASRPPTAAGLESSPSTGGSSSNGPAGLRMAGRSSSSRARAPRRRRGSSTRCLWTEPRAGFFRRRRRAGSSPRCPGPGPEWSTCREPPRLRASAP